MTVFVNLAGLAIIGLIVWWFWLSKPRATGMKDRAIEVIVENGVYTPARIQIPRGHEVTVRFIRKDPNPCAEQIIIESLDLAETLPLNKPVEIKLKFDSRGEYSFNCQMKMYQGWLEVI